MRLRGRKRLVASGSYHRRPACTEPPRHRLTLASLLALFYLSPVDAATAPPALSAYSALYGARCQTLDTSARGGSRLCTGVAGYDLVVYDDDDRATIDIVAPGNALYPLSYWDVVTTGYATVGRKAEWRMGKRNGKRVPTALLVRLTRLDVRNPGELIAVARIDGDGACVVYRGDLADGAVEQAARRAAANPASKCLGPDTTE